MAVKDINAAGGVNGQQLVLQIGDDACDPKQATAVANKLVSDKVVFVAGHYCSGSSIPASDIYKEAKILQITPASTNIKLTDDAFAKGNTTVFRTCGRDDVQGATVSAYILKNKKGAKVAILHDKSPYGKGVADETKKGLNAGGMKEAMYEAYNDTDKDFSALINKMKQAKIDMIVLGGYHTAAAMLVKQSREQGFGAQLVGFDALEDPEFGKLGGAATDGVLMSFPPKAEDFPANAALVKKFRDSGYDPTGYTLFTYAAVKVWADAANKAKSIDAAAVAAALRQGTYQSAVGPLTYDQKGDIKNPVYDIYVWKNGKSSPVGK
jgi:branched-chain amino acid transport system substrate-binding protein